MNSPELRTYQVLLKSGKHREAIYECFARSVEDAKKTAADYVVGTIWRIKGASEAEF